MGKPIKPGCLVIMTKTVKKFRDGIGHCFVTEGRMDSTKYHAGECVFCYREDNFWELVGEERVACECALLRIDDYDEEEESLDEQRKAEKARLERESALEFFSDWEC